jgi:DNA polymerase III sliding clamp (beta) subunit (PCNA family)
MAMGFDRLCGVIAKSPVDLDCCVSAKKLCQVLAGLIGEVRVKMDRDALVVQSGRHRTRLNTAPSAGYPDIMPKSLGVFYSGPDFATAAFEASFSVALSTNAHFGILGGVGFDGQYCYSSDSFRMTRIRLQGKASRRVVISAEAAKMLCSFGDPERVHVSETVLYTTWQQPLCLVLLGTLQDEKFPFQFLESKFSQPRDPNYDCEFPLDTVQAIRRVQAIYGGKDGATFLEGQRNHLVISSEQTEGGVSEETLDASFPKPFKAAVTGSYLVQVLLKTLHANLGELLAGTESALAFRTKGFDHLLAIRS